MSDRSLLARVRATIEKHRMLPAGETVLVGVSGGADSVCLVRVLCELGFRPGVAHVNHGWRGEASDADAKFAAHLAGILGLPFFEHRATSGAGTVNRESVAREIRQRFFAETADSNGYEKLALAHSTEDRAETFLLNLLRGAGARGLTSMRPVSGKTVRPLIEVARDEIEAFLVEIGQPWRDDSTNWDTRLARNRIRHAVLPGLASDFNPRLRETLSRTIGILEAEDEWMDALATEWLEPRASEEGATLIVEVDDLGSQPIPLIRRVLRASLRRAGSPMEDVGFDHIESVRSLLEPGKSGRIIELPGKFTAERSFQTLAFYREIIAPSSYQYALTIPGHVHIPEIGTVFRARSRTPEAVKPNPGAVFVDGESLGPYVTIRNWKNGDAYHPVGESPSKLKELFQRNRVPRRERRHWPVVVARSSIVWVASFPVSREFAPTGSSRRIIEFEAIPVAKMR